MLNLKVRLNVDPVNKLKYYIGFCKKFRNIKFPKLKFKELNEGYKNLYRNVYNLDEDDINKATSFLFSVFFISIVLISLILMSNNFLLIIFYSLIVSIIISYIFNTRLYKKIRKEEIVLNALLYLIKISFSLIKKTLKGNTDYIMIFINLIKDYNLPLSENFKIVLRKIHEGNSPEKELSHIITPSEDFNQYIRELLVNNLNSDYKFNRFDENSSERSFRIVLRDVESKISIIFFIGLFLPIGLCFLIIFQQIHPILLILIIPLFLILLNFLFRKFIKIDIFLIGLLKEYSSNEKKKFDEFLLFLKTFAINLKNNISPEKAFITAYLQNKNYFLVLNEALGNQVNYLLNFSYPFNEMVEQFKSELNNLRCNLILDTIKSMINKNAYYSSNKIFEILDIIDIHRKLENKLSIIIKGEKFRVLIFLFLLPIIIGAIGGMIPLFTMVTNANSSNFPQNSSNFPQNSFSLVNFLLIFLTLLSCNLISSYYFLKIVFYEKKYFLILFSNLIYILTFFIIFMNPVFN